jgi:hypothetical protein
MGIAWLTENRDLFTGGGVALLTAGFTGLWHLVKTIRRRRLHNGLLNLDVTLDRLSQPPLGCEQDVWQKSYSGMPVRGRGKLLDIERLGGDLIRVELRCHRDARVHFVVPRLQYPELVDAPRNKKIIVVGKLSGTYRAIEITDVSSIEIVRRFFIEL